MSKFCQSCGTESPSRMQFCVKCGAAAFGPTPPAAASPLQSPLPTTPTVSGHPKWHTPAPSHTPAPQYRLPPGRSVVDAFRGPKERLYQAIMLGIGTVVWIGILLGIRSAAMEPELLVNLLGFGFYIVAALMGYLISAAAYRATAFGNMILLGPNQFPELHNMVVSGANELGMHIPPKAFLYNSNGVFNAFARRLLGGPYVFLTSALVEANSDEQVKFVIGHELGHHAAGHLNPWLNLIKLPAYMVPFLGRAYSRSRELTCDAIGSHLSKDPVASETAIQMLACGCSRLNQRMSCDAFLEQESMVPPIFGFLTEIFRTHPRLTRRVAALRKLARRP